LFILLKNVSDIVERIIVFGTSSNRVIWSSVRGGAGGGTTAGVVSEAGTATGVGIGVGAAIVEDTGAGATVDGGRAGLDAPASADNFTGAVPGFGGRDGCKGEAESDVIGGSTFVSVTGVKVGAAVGVSCNAVDSCKAMAAAALARACAKRSAFFMSCFLRMSIRVSSCLTFFTKSLTSPGLRIVSTGLS
jgi:hypothetical protein